jgi:hypothetical protein
MKIKKTLEPEQILGFRPQIHHSVLHCAADIAESTRSELGGSLQNDVNQ